MRTRCHDCDRPRATKEDFYRDDREGDDGLCWVGMCPQVDWRARALAAEERVAMIQQGDRVDVAGGGKRYETMPDPLARFAALIADAETCAISGAATKQAKCIAALAKALRESQASCDEAKRTLRAIVEMVR